MPVNPFMLEGASGVLLHAARDCRAVRVIRAQAQLIGPENLPYDVALATAAVTSAITKLGEDVPYIVYDDIDEGTTAVDTYIDDDGGDVGQVLVGNYKCWSNCDAASRVHFARQSMRYSLAAKNWSLVYFERFTDAWQVVRLGLGMYFAILRAGMTGRRLTSMNKLAAAAGSRGSDFISVAIGGTTNETVVPTGMGILQPLLDEIEASHAKMRETRKQMTDRLPFPVEASLRNPDPVIKRACSLCSKPDDPPPPTPP